MRFALCLGVKTQESYYDITTYSILQAQRLGPSFKEQLSKYGKGEVPVKDMLKKLMRDTVKADESKLPHICSLDWEFNLSSIFVEVDTPLVNIIYKLHKHYMQP